MAFTVESWYSWPAVARATATLVSIRSCGVSSLVGIAQPPDKIVADRSVGGRNYEQTLLVGQAVVRQRRYVQPGPIHGYLDMAGHKADALPQRSRDNQPPGLIYGCPHTIRIPRLWNSKTHARGGK